MATMCPADSEKIRQVLQNVLSRNNIDLSNPWPESLCNWIMCNICLNLHIASKLREHVESTFENLYKQLKATDNIHNQCLPNILKFYSKTSRYHLNYENINNNNNQHGNFDFRVQNAVDLSKLFVKGLSAQYQNFDSCDPSALLNSIINCSGFTTAIQNSAKQCRQVRNKCAHYDHSVWEDEKVDEYYFVMEELVKNLTLSPKEKSLKIYEILQFRHKGKEVFCRNSGDLDQTKLSPVLREIRQMLDEILVQQKKQITEGTNFKQCSLCGEQIQALEIWSKTAKDVQQSGDNNYKEQDELGAHLIKLYPLLKDEMQKSEVLCVASQLLRKTDVDIRESIELCGTRRSAVDKLLKLVLRKNSYLNELFNILKTHWNSTTSISDMMEKSRPNAIEITEYKVSFEPREKPSRNEKVKFFKDNDYERFQFKIQSFDIIDSLNNCFLSKFFFRLLEHDSICVDLDGQNVRSASSNLLDTMEKCSVDIMAHFCETLEERHIFNRRMSEEVRAKYISSDISETPREERAMPICTRTFWSWESLQRLWNCLRRAGFEILSEENGSLIIHLRRNETYKSDMITDVINTVYAEICHPGFRQFEIQTVFYEDEFEKNEEKRRTVLKIDINDQSTAGKSTFDTNIDTFKYNQQLLSEELEINDDFIYFLQKADVLPNDISGSLIKMETRASKVQRILELLDPQIEGYNQIKKYVKHSNAYLYDSLMERETFIKRLNVVVLFRGRSFEGGERTIKEVTSLSGTEKAIDITSAEKVKIEDEKERTDERSIKEFANLSDTEKARDITSIEKAKSEDEKERVKPEHTHAVSLQDKSDESEKFLKRQSMSEKMKMKMTQYQRASDLEIKGLSEVQKYETFLERQSMSELPLMEMTEHPLASDLEIKGVSEVQKYETFLERQSMSELPLKEMTEHPLASDLEIKGVSEVQKYETFLERQSMSELPLMEMTEHPLASDLEIKGVSEVQEYETFLERQSMSELPLKEMAHHRLASDLEIKGVSEEYETFLERQSMSELPLMEMAHHRLASDLEIKGVSEVQESEKFLKRKSDLMSGLPPKKLAKYQRESDLEIKGLSEVQVK